MVIARYSETKSDSWIKEKMVQHLGSHHKDRNLMRQLLDSGYGDRGENHAIYYLHGSPIKAYAVLRSSYIHFYEASGKRWATYNLSGSPAIEHEISKPNQKYLDGEHP